MVWSQCLTVPSLWDWEHRRVLVVPHCTLPRLTTSLTPQSRQNCRSAKLPQNTKTAQQARIWPGGWKHSKKQIDFSGICITFLLCFFAKKKEVPNMKYIQIHVTVISANIMLTLTSHKCLHIVYSTTAYNKTKVQIELCGGLDRSCDLVLRQRYCTWVLCHRLVMAEDRIRPEWPEIIRTSFIPSSHLWPPSTNCEMLRKRPGFTFV